MAGERINISACIGHGKTIFSKNNCVEAESLLVRDIRFSDQEEHFRFLGDLTSRNTDLSAL